MARKNNDPKSLPPPANSSSDDEETEESGEEEEEEADSSSDEQEDNTPSTPADKKIAVPKKKSASESGSGSGSGSESDSDLPPSPDTNSKKPRSDAAMASPVKTPSRKRPAESEKREAVVALMGKDPKRAKVEKRDGEVEEGKKPLFQRLWSEDDEVAILKGMIEYKSKNGVNPKPDSDDFYILLKKSLHVDVNKTQIANKVKRLKKMFMTNSEKKKQINNPHYKVLFDLSEKIWGSEGFENTVAEKHSSKSNSKHKKNMNFPNRIVNVNSNEEKPYLWISKCKNEGVEFGKKRSGFVDFDGGIVEEGLELLEDKQREMLEEKWRTQKVAEMEVFLSRLEVMAEQAKLVLEALKGSGH